MTEQTGQTEQAQQAQQARERIVGWARERYEDLSFGHARRWCEEFQAKAIGHLPVYAPREIIDAAGMLPVGILGGGDQLEIIRGDAFYQSYICHLPRSVIELGQSGRLDFLSGVLFPSTCDVIRNLSGMWQVLHPEVYVRYVDLPQSDDRAIAQPGPVQSVPLAAQGLQQVVKA